MSLANPWARGLPASSFPAFTQRQCRITVYYARKKRFAQRVDKFLN